MDTFTVTTAKRSCSGKDTINKDGELQRLREMLDMVRSQKPDKSGDGDGGVSRGGEGGQHIGERRAEDHCGPGTISPT